MWKGFIWLIAMCVSYLVSLVRSLAHFSLVCLLPYCWVLRVLSEKAMAPHSSILAWRIPGTEEPGGLPSMGSHRVGHDWSDLAAARVLCIFWITVPYQIYVLHDIFPVFWSSSHSLDIFFCGMEVFNFNEVTAYQLFLSWNVICMWKVITLPKVI